MMDYLTLMFRVIAQREGASAAYKHFEKKATDLDGYFAANYHTFDLDAPTELIYDFSMQMGGEELKTALSGVQSFTDRFEMMVALGYITKCENMYIISHLGTKKANCVNS